MSTMWLKRVDALSTFVPRVALTCWPSSPQTNSRAAILRPGGLGDLVVLTRALLELGFSPAEFSWITEKRNSIWLEYLGVPFFDYDAGFGAIFKLFSLPTGAVINTEQYHGLAAVVSRLLARPSYPVIGFSSHRRADLQSISLPHNLAHIRAHSPAENRESEHELSAFKRLLTAASEVTTRQMGQTATPFRLPAGPAQDPSVAVVGLAGTYAEDKALSEDQWLEVISRAKSGAKRVVLLGSEREQLLASAIASKIGSESENQIENQVGRLRFGETVNYIRSAARFYGVDGGLMHIADFFGVPCSVIFPRNNVSQWRPLTSGSIVWDVHFRERDGERAPEKTGERTGERNGEKS